MSSANEPISIPDDLEDLTPEWLSAVLDADVASVEANPLSVGTTGRVYRLALETRGSSEAAESPATVIVKLPAEDLETRAFFHARGLYRNEAQFYELLAADSGIEPPIVTSPERRTIRVAWPSSWRM